MKIYIDETKLKLLLSEHKDSIGTKSSSTIDSLISAVALIISCVLSTYTDWIFPGIVWKTICVMFGLYFAGRAVYMLISSRKNNYDTDKLFEDMKSLNELAHKHSIIAIKDTFNEHANRLLVYYDDAWGCWLFPNCKTLEDNNDKNILERISNQLKVDTTKIRVEFLHEALQSKYSYSREEDRVYLHRLYRVIIDSFNTDEMDDEFTIDGRKFRWMTISEMQNDEVISKRNSEVVSFVQTFVS